MNLERALEIINKAAVAVYRDKWAGEVTRNGHKVMELCGDDNIAYIDEKGGEDEGSEYYYIFQVRDGDDKALVKYEGDYDSWNGVTWWFEPKLVEKYEYTCTGYREV